MKIHNILIESISRALVEVFVEGKYSERIVDYELKVNKKWGARDRRFFAENLYECVRWIRKLLFLLDLEHADLCKIDVSLAKKIWATNWIINNLEIPENIALSHSEVIKIKERNNIFLIEPSQLPLEIKESIPDWMMAWGVGELGEKWPKILHSLNQKSQIDLRVNTLLVTKEKLMDLLLEQEIDVRSTANDLDSLSLLKRKNVFTLDLYKKGFFEVQDQGSQRVSLFVNPEPGQRIIDACAGAGGKSLHLSTIMKNKGKIISLDISERKLIELRKRASRNKINIIETRFIENSKTIKRLSESADKVLLDVPCSGMGVLRRHPDTKWKLDPKKIEEIHQIQKTILSDYSKMVKVGGELIYATCSMMPSENQHQVENFLKENENFDFMDSISIDPDQDRGDGFFAAKLHRKH